MKRKLLLLLFALFFWTGTMLGQDTNLALNKTAIATSGTASFAVDGNVGTRWESASSDPQTWQVDLGSDQTVRSFVIVWQTAYTENYTITVAAEGAAVDGAGFITDGTEVASGTNAAGKAELWTQVINLDADQTVRYVKFTGTSRATIWGHSFWEFGVYGSEQAEVLSNLTLTAAKTSASVGDNVALTVTGKNQYGGVITEMPTLTYTSSVPAVGTVSDGVFHAAGAGTTTITVKNSDETVQATVDITVLAGSKVDLFSGDRWQNVVVPYNEASAGSLNSRNGMVDENTDSQWALCDNGAAEDGTYGFVLDLRNTYDISSITARYDGASPKDVTIAFSTDGETYTNAYSYTETSSGAGIVVNRTYDSFTGTTTGIRYVRFISEGLNTGWGLKIKDFSVYGTLNSTTSDTDAPSKPTVTEGAKTTTAITLNATSTDACRYLKYDVTYTPAGGVATTKTFHTADNVSGSATPLTITGLTLGTQYTITVTATDAFGNSSTSDAVVITTSGTVVLTTLTVTPASAAVVTSGTTNLTVVAIDEDEVDRSASVVLTADNGATIDGTTLTIANAGKTTVTATFNEQTATCVVIGYTGSNLALNNFYKADNYNGGSHLVGYPETNAVDGNINTVWASRNNGACELTLNPAITYVVDLGKNYVIDLVKIFYEGAAVARDFTIDFSNDAATWTNNYAVADAANTNERVDNIIGVLQDTKYRFVRFRATKGYSDQAITFKEFEVYGHGEEASPNTTPVISFERNSGVNDKNVSFDLSATDTQAGMLTFTLDKMGGPGVVESTLDTWTATSDAAAHVYNTTVAEYDTYFWRLTVTNRNGQSAESYIIFTVADPNKYSANLVNSPQQIWVDPDCSREDIENVIVSGAEPATGDWKLRSEDGAQREYNAGFIADLKGVYDLSEIELSFDANSTAYTLQVSANGSAWTTVKTVTHDEEHARELGVVDDFTTTSDDPEKLLDASQLEGVRYVKFVSTRVHPDNNYGVWIKRFFVKGTGTAEENDNTAPELTAPTENAKTTSTLTVNLSATDSHKFVIYHVTVKKGDDVVSTADLQYTDDISGTTATYTVGNLQPNTEYTVNVTAED
ncbi:MAG: discoidin domain-containing protein, partial [Prevotella sp.]|nr:discoidin domain-containing protein [Prevotella sp.]